MTELFQYTFFRNALLGILIISIASAIIGTYIMTRRTIFITGGITHACFGGLGLGYYLGINPIFTATLFAVASSVSVEWLSSRIKLREDSAIAVVWAIGMAIGVLFVFLTPGYVPDLNSFLFGNILTITTADLWSFAIFTILLIAFFVSKYHVIIACTFDRDFATVSRMPVRLISYAMTIAVAVCIVLTIRLVGIMLLISMLSLPQMIAETIYQRFRPMMIASVIISMIAGAVGLSLSAMIDVPCSSLIVLILAAIYIVARIGQTIRHRRAMQ